VPRLDEQRRVRLSKLLSLILRHKPELVGARLDREGFADVEIPELARRISKLRGMSWVEPEHILEVVRLDPKGRFEIRGSRIRATYGHSLLVEPVGEPTREVPDVLYHGTTEQALNRILREGIKPMGRRFVHLTTNPEDALIVARRHGERVVILEIDAKKMVEDGLPIWKASEVVFLAELVPPEYMSVRMGLRKKV